MFVQSSDVIIMLPLSEDKNVRVHYEREYLDPLVSSDLDCGKPFTVYDPDARYVVS